MYDSWLNLAAEHDLAANCHHSPELVFAHCSAICHLACTMEGVDVPLEFLATMATKRSENLHGDAVTQLDVVNEAVALTLALNSAPSVACWISIFCARFDVAAHANFAGQLQHCACGFALRFAYDVPASPDQLPRKTALGSFTLALLMKCVVQPGDLQPRLLRHEGWSWLLTHLRAMQYQEDGHASPPSLDPEIFLPVFEAATRTTLEEACADAITVAVVSRG